MQQEKQQPPPHYSPDVYEDVVIYDESGFPIGMAKGRAKEEKVNGSAHSVDAIDESGFVIATVGWDDPSEQSDNHPQDEKSSGSLKTLALFLATVGAIALCVNREGKEPPKAGLSQKQPSNPIIFFEQKGKIKCSSL